MSAVTVSDLFSVLRRGFRDIYFLASCFDYHRQPKKKIICYPLKDNRKRFLLGRKGNSELLAVGLNPSTANESSMDPTSKNIESIANQNGFDGWWLVNLYPGRYPKPKDLPKKPKKNYLKHLLNNHDRLPI